MSLFLASRALGAFAYTVVLAAAVGCHHRSFVAGERSSRERLKGGYGEPLAEYSGGAIQTLTAEQVNQRAVGRVEELFEGRFSGVDVIRTASGGFLVRVRGVGTFLGRQDPLYVIDGVPVPVDPARGLDWLSPGTIRRITVLKAPPETSIYGVRGANGVILIETR
jgi:TonB-dependent SusC/RagA subfamily outer membrane receptor